MDKIYFGGVKMFEKNLKYLRNKFNMEQIDLAHRLGRKSSSSVSEWEKGKYTPKIKTLAEIAQIFKVDLDDLMNADLSQVETSLVDKIADISSQLQEVRQQKVYNYAEHQLEEQNKVIHIHKDNGDYITETLRGYLSAGTGELQLEEVLEEVEIPVEIIPEQHYDMLLQINGDSMLPMFQDGERIFVRKIEDTGELRSGQIGVFIIDGESYLKKAYKEDNQLRLVSLNDKYDDLIFNEVNDIEVIGTVVM